MSNPLDNVSIREKIGQMFMVGFKGLKLTKGAKEFISRNSIGFVVIFSRNVESPSQVIKLTNEIHSLGKIPPMIFTDQEGGLVCQFGEMVSTFTSPMGIAATTDLKNAEIAGEGIGRDLSALGIDGVLAPVVDVNYNPDNLIIGARAFSDDPDTVTSFAAHFVYGLKRTGVAPVLKHFPGHGGTGVDSHHKLPIVAESEEYTRAMNIRPYFILAPEVDFIMTAHVNFPWVDEAHTPASFSEYFINRILRREIGFKGVVFTDCLEMGAIKKNFSPEEIIRKGINAGVDVFLVSHSLRFQKVLFEKLLGLVKRGEIPEERINSSYERILNAKKKYGVLKRKKNPLHASLRINRKKEEEICRKSIVVLRNKKGLIPIPEGTKLGIIEWAKAPATMPLEAAFERSYLINIAREYFPRAEVLILPPFIKEYKTAEHFIRTHSVTIVAPYSRFPEAEKVQGEMIRRFLSYKENIIVVSLGNPYDIREFPFAHTFVASFGFRECNIRGLFDVLSGRSKPFGRLPVEIRGIFPRWHKFEELK